MRVELIPKLPFLFVRWPPTVIVNSPSLTSTVTSSFKAGAPFRVITTCRICFPLDPDVMGILFPPRLFRIARQASFATEINTMRERSATRT